MNEHPELSLPLPLPLPRPGPFAAPDGYHRVRETPGLATAELPGGALTWLVTRLEEARAALAAPEFSTDRSDPAFPLPQQRPRPAGAGPRPNLTPAERRFRARGASLIGMDPPDHTTARRAVIGEFTARPVQALRPRIQQIVDERIAALRAAGPPADLVSLLSLPVPSQVICELLGVPYEQHEFFQSRSTALLTHRVPAEQRFEALGELFRFLDELVTAQEESPGENLLGRQVVARRAAGDYDHRDLVSLAFLLLVAGHETTASMISLGALAVMAYEDDGAAARPAGGGDRSGPRPAGGGGAAPVLLHRRHRHRPVRAVGGLDRRDHRPAGRGRDRLAAGRQPRPGPVPGPGSAGPGPAGPGAGGARHVAFGYGPHQCLGQSLARAELDIVYRTLFTQLPGLRLAVPLDELPVKDDGFVYGLYELPVTW